MVLSAQLLARSDAVIWHELECGAYTADLGLWEELAERYGAAGVLDIGAGCGRVALTLAGRGHRVIAIERDRALFSELQARAAGLPLQVVCADARSFSLAGVSAGLCIVAMQTIQLLGAGSERAQFLRTARAHLRAGALLACAIVEDLEPFDGQASGNFPSAESVHVGAVLYRSRATRLTVDRGGILIERQRTIESRERCSDEPDQIWLELLSAAQLQREAVGAGFELEPSRVIAATSEYTGSTVVMLRAR